MPRYGYARVSSTDQDCALQEARLRDAGCEVIRAERVSGKSRDGRDELARIMDFLHARDELVVVKLDRLGRSTRDVLNPRVAERLDPSHDENRPNHGRRSWQTKSMSRCSSRGGIP